MKKRTEQKPTLINRRTAAGERSFVLLRDGARIVDTYPSQLAELCLIEKPGLIRTAPQERADAIRAFVGARIDRSPVDRQGTWAYLPWQNTMVHLLPEPEFVKVRTNRNGNLITRDEQGKFYECTVGIAGLSVGGSIALSIVLQGGAKHIRIADFDDLELSNTNRILAGVHELALPKTTIVARRIWEMNPYADVQVFDKGLDEKNIGTFMKGLDVVVDEMDAMHIKQLIREYARTHRIAFVSTADNGDTSVVDVERHDQKRTPFFLGRLGRTSVTAFQKMDKLQIIREITRLMGPENVPARMQDSLPEIGTSLVSVPQLGGTALMGAAATAYCVRRIAAGLPLPSGRAIVSLDEKLLPGHGTPAARKEHRERTKRFAKRYGL